MAVAVICECNPFHNGHKYLFETAKKISGEPLVAVMSGSFTQRGEAAIADKFVRTKAMLKNGADLVVELPTVYAVSNAQHFAQGGVSIAKAFDSVRFLAFGCESDDISALNQAAQAVDNSQVKAELNKLMKTGDYYPRALQTAVNKVYGKQISDIMSEPNNVLALEYIRALKDSPITALPIQRTGTAHDSSEISGSFASASLIRQLLSQKKDVSLFMPNCEYYNEITNPDNLERAMLYKLRTLTRDGLAMLPDVNEGLENRIYEAVRSYDSVKEIISAIKTKRYTHSRIRRILICALLGITKADSQAPVEYARVLGFTGTGASLLKECRLNVVTSVSNGLKIGGNTEKLLSKDILATDISGLAYDNVRISGADFYTPVIKPQQPEYYPN